MLHALICPAALEDSTITDEYIFDIDNYVYRLYKLYRLFYMSLMRLAISKNVNKYSNIDNYV